MPSTTSSSVSRLLASSTVITPSLPTFCIASAIILPIDLSPFEEIVPTCAISAESLIFFERSAMSLTAAMTARSTPRLRSIGFMPAATALAPSLTIEWARTVAVVVPSPAVSLVFEATSRTIWAPMFSNLSSSSISLATVTPSLVMRGAPNDLSRMTLRPFGPSVTLTALARMSTPRSILSRASVEKRTSLAAMLFRPVRSVGWGKSAVGSRGRGGACAGTSFRLPTADCLLPPYSTNHAHDVGFLHDQEVLTVDLDLGAGPLPEQHLVAGLDVERRQLAAFVATAGASGDNLAFLRLLLGGVRNDDAALRLLLAFEALDDDAVMQGTEFHLDCLPVSSLPTRCVGRRISCEASLALY